MRPARQGASTLTQQLARNSQGQFGLTRSEETSILERKIKELILAIQIEKRYTKREIFTIYCNQMYLGPRRVRRRGRVAAVFRQVRTRS